MHRLNHPEVYHEHHPRPWELSYPLPPSRRLQRPSSRKYTFDHHLYHTAPPHYPTPVTAPHRPSSPYWNFSPVTPVAPFRYLTPAIYPPHPAPTGPYHYTSPVGPATYLAPVTHLDLPDDVPPRVSISHNISAAFQPVQADDKVAMLQYYTYPVKKKKPTQRSNNKKMRKSSSTGTLEYVIDIVRKPIDEFENIHIPKDSSTMLPGLFKLKLLGQQIKRNETQRESVGVCTEEDEREIDFDIDDQQPLVIDLPEEDSAKNTTEGRIAHSDKVTSRDNTTLSTTDSSSSTPVKPQPASIKGQLPETPNADRADDLLSYDLTAKPPIVPRKSPLMPPSLPTPPDMPSLNEKGKFGCKRCHRFFSSIVLLVKHRSSCQNEVKVDAKQVFPCSECGERFTSSKACSDHWKEFHCTRRPHQCVKCGRRFTLSRALEKHSRVHKQ